MPVGRRGCVRLGSVGLLPVRMSVQKAGTHPRGAEVREAGGSEVGVELQQFEGK